MKKVERADVPITCTHRFTQVVPLWCWNSEGQPFCDVCAYFLELYGVLPPVYLTQKVTEKWLVRGRGLTQVLDDTEREATTGHEDRF